MLRSSHVRNKRRNGFLLKGFCHNVKLKIEQKRADAGLKLKPLLHTLNAAQFNSRLSRRRGLWSELLRLDSLSESKEVHKAL